jgi:hypothetical protein
MITNFLQSSPGNFSSTRLMFVIGLLWAMTITTIGAFMLKWSPGEIIAVYSALSGISVGLKLGQKPMEGKTPKQVQNGTGL